MIDIVMSGMCEGCEYADLVLDSVSGDGMSGRKSWLIECSHLMACLAMKKKMQRQIPEEDPRGKTYTADEFVAKLKDFINQEHEKLEDEE